MRRFCNRSSFLFFRIWIVVSSRRRRDSSWSTPFLNVFLRSLGPVGGPPNDAIHRSSAAGTIARFAQATRLMYAAMALDEGPALPNGPRRGMRGGCIGGVRTEHHTYPLYSELAFD